MTGVRFQLSAPLGPDLRPVWRPIIGKVPMSNLARKLKMNFLADFVDPERDDLVTSGNIPGKYPKLPLLF
jgi:hypothetical protein